MQTEFWISLFFCDPPGEISLFSVEACGTLKLAKTLSMPLAHQHSEWIIEAVQSLVAELPSRRISRILLADAAGSYTGLRIAMATAKAFFFFWECPIEVMDCSELRFLEWKLANPEFRMGTVAVVHQHSGRRYQLQTFRVKEENFQSEEKRIVGADFSFSGFDRILVAPGMGFGTPVVLGNEGLVRQREAAKSMKTYASYEALAALSPSYSAFGA